jgi:TonB family protein
MTFVQVIVGSTWKGTVILFCAFGGVAALRRTSASVRHAVWVSVFGVLLALPAALWFAPRWNFVVGTPAQQFWATALPVSVSVVTRGQAPHLAVPWLLMVWLAGAAAAATRYLIGAARAFWLVRRSAPAPYATAGATPVRAGVEITVPMAWGFWRPVVLLPLSAREWAPERLRSALLHETTHIRRGDLWIQVLSQAVSSVYWFHPLVWLAARQLRRERERTCDDAVLRAGLAAPEYAGHLIDLARTLASRSVQAPAMADRSDLEARVRALLDRRRDRRPLSWQAAAGIAAASLILLLPMAAVHAEARRTPPPPAPLVLALPTTPLPAPSPAKRASAPPAPVRLLAQAPAPRPTSGPLPDIPINTQVPAIHGPISGIVLDPTGAVVPGCQVFARSLDRPAAEIAGAVGRTDAAGRYKFDSLAPGRYLLQFDVPGFQPVLIMARDDGPQYVWLTVGSMNESVVVGAPKPAVTGVAPAPGPQRIRVGGNVQPSRLISRTEPVYPPELQQLGIEGTVIIRAIISKTGEPANLQVINTGIDPRLARAALDSVSQWRYQPTLLNGQPVEVETTVTVDFKLEP